MDSEEKSRDILKRSFYERDIFTVAKDLIGKEVVHETHLGKIAGKIVETEAYLGPEDKASHAFNNLRTKRTETQFGPKGHAYIYLIYGMYYCFNTTAGKIPGKPEAVLMRALEPTEGIDLMKKLRVPARGQIKHLTNGPSKLCMALGLTKNQNGADLCTRPFYIREGKDVEEANIVHAARIGVAYAEEWSHEPWRFYIKNNPFVSIGTK